MTSLELVRELYRRGTLTKEAGVALLKKRESIIKQAMSRESTLLFRNLFSMSKEAGLGEGFRSLMGKGKEVAQKAEGLSGPGFFSKLRIGGATPAGGDKPMSHWGDVGANLLKMIGIATLSAGATAGVSSLLKAKTDRELRKDIEQSYSKMFTEYPRLNEIEESHPGKVRAHFGVLAKFAPSLAADPMVAGSFVQTAATQTVIDPATIKNLSETQRRIDEMQESHSPMAAHFDRGITLARNAMMPGSGGK